MSVLKNQVKKFIEKSDVEDGNRQTPAIEKITGTQSFRDTLTLRRRSKKFKKLVLKLKRCI